MRGWGICGNASQPGDKAPPYPIQPLDATPFFPVVVERQLQPVASQLRAGIGVGHEEGGLDPVALQQLVELGAIAPCELRGLRDASLGKLEDAREVVALEALARVLERRHL